MSDHTDRAEGAEPAAATSVARERAAGPAAEAVPCAQCGRIGAAGRFCGHCGAALWQRCPRCSVEMRACDRFCTACGTDVPALLARQAEAARQSVASAQQLAAVHRYEEATACLHRVLAELDDPRLGEVAQLASAALAEIQTRYVAVQKDAERRVERAGQLKSAGRWREARRELEKIPVALRGPAVTALDDELASMIQREAQLREQIAQAIAGKRLVELAPLVEELHALRPQDAAACKLAENLRQQMIPRARQYLDSGRDSLAWRALKAIPSFAVDEPTQALLDETRERLALREAVAGAAYATSSLAGLLRRLAKLSPQAADVPKWRQKLAEQAGKAPEDPHLPAARWTAAASRGRLNMAVEAWAYFARPLLGQDEVQRTLQRHPGQFFTALGLALEAVGVAPLACDLSPPREGLLAQLSAAGRRGARAAWAVDLGATAVKVLRLSRDGESLRIDAALHLPVPEQAANQVESYEEALKKVAEAVSQSPALVCVGLPGRWLLGRFFEMPAMKGRSWEQALHHEARHQLPLALEELCWQAVVVCEQPAAAEGPAMRRVVLQAARRSQVEQLLAVCRTAGLAVARVQSEPLALHQAVQWELQGSSSSRSPVHGSTSAVLIVDWGASQTHIIHSGVDRLMFRALAKGTDEWANRLGAVFAQRKLAENRALLTEPAKAPTFRPWQEAELVALEALTGQIQWCMASFGYSRETQPQLLIGVGGGFQVHGVVSCLRRPAE